MRAVEVGVIVLALLMLSTIAYADEDSKKGDDGGVYTVKSDVGLIEIKPHTLQMLSPNAVPFDWQYIDITYWGNNSPISYNFGLNFELVPDWADLQMLVSVTKSKPIYEMKPELTKVEFGKEADIKQVEKEPENCDIGEKSPSQITPNLLFYEYTDWNHTIRNACLNTSDEKAVPQTGEYWATHYVDSGEKEDYVEQEWQEFKKAYSLFEFEEGKNNPDGMNISSGIMLVYNEPIVMSFDEKVSFRIKFDPSDKTSNDKYGLGVFSGTQTCWMDNTCVDSLWVDPWWNTSKSNRTPLFVNNIDSIDHVNEPLIYNLSGICNDVTPAVAYNNSGTLEFYPFYNISGSANWSIEQYVAPTPNKVYLRVLVNSTAGAGVWNWGEIYCGGVATTQPPFVVFSENFTDNHNRWSLVYDAFINTTEGTLWAGTSANPCNSFVAMINVSSPAQDNNVNGTMTYRVLQEGISTTPFGTPYSMVIGSGASGSSTNWNTTHFHNWDVFMVAAGTNSSIQQGTTGNALKLMGTRAPLLNWTTTEFYRFGSDGVNASVWNGTNETPYISNATGLGPINYPSNQLTYVGIASYSSLGNSAGFVGMKIDDFAWVWSGVTNDIYGRTYNVTAAGGIGTTDTSALNMFIWYPINITGNSSNLNFTVTANSTNASYTCNYTRNGVTNGTNFTVLNDTLYSVNWFLPFSPYVLSSTCSNGSQTSTANVTFVVRQLVGWVNTSVGTTVVQSTLNTTNCTANIFGSPVWVNFTISNSTDIVVNNVNGTIYPDGNWSSINFTPYYIDTFYCNISVYDGRDTITNYSTFNVVGATAPNITEITTNRGLSFDILTENTTYCMVNVTDLDGNSTIRWVNFTITNPASVVVLSAVNGTNISMSTWISQNFTAGLAGAWTCTVKAYDGVSQPFDSKGFSVTTPGGGGGGGGGGGAPPTTIIINQTAVKKNVTVSYPVPRVDIKGFLPAGIVYDVFAWIQKNSVVPVVIGAIIFIFVNEMLGSVLVLYGVGVLFGVIGVTL